MNLVGRIEQLTGPGPAYGRLDELVGTGCKPAPYLTEERVREIVREELKKLLGERTSPQEGESR